MTRPVTPRTADPGALRGHGHPHDPDFLAGVVAEYGHRSAVETARMFGLPSKSAVCGIWHRARRDGLVERKFDARPHHRPRKWPAARAEAPTPSRAPVARDGETR